MPDDYREVVIAFGKDGYLACYPFERGSGDLGYTTPTGTGLLKDRVPSQQQIMLLDKQVSMA